MLVLFLDLRMMGEISASFVHFLFVFDLDNNINWTRVADYVWVIIVGFA